IAAIGTPYRLYSGDGTATNPGLGRYCQPVLADGSVADLQAWATAALPPSLQGVFDLAARDAATTASTQVAQAEVDKAAVAAHPDYIVVGRTILATEGTAPDLSGLAASVAALPSAAEVAAAILAAPANKLATDANGQVTAANSGGLTQQQAALLTAIGEAAGTLTVAERNAVADSLLDRAAAIDSKTVRQALCIIAAPIAGEVRGVGTERETFKGLDGVTDRVQVTVDAAGNRSSVTYP
ncbi:MAG: hypothetical protein LLG00_12320, partial [Planctomycetaceae bacterium]|nr:hypothetical protein [Planctomycetaceae bacterium]